MVYVILLFLQQIIIASSAIDNDSLKALGYGELLKRMESIKTNILSSEFKSPSTISQSSDPSNDIYYLTYSTYPGSTCDGIPYQITGTLVGNGCQPTDVNDDLLNSYRATCTINSDGTEYNYTALYYTSDDCSGEISTMTNIPYPITCDYATPYMSSQQSCINTVDIGVEGIYQLYYDTPTCECPNDSNNAYDSFFKTNLNVCAQFNETNSIVYTSCTDEVSTLVTYYEKGDCTGVSDNVITPLLSCQETSDDIIVATAEFCSVDVPTCPEGEPTSDKDSKVKWYNSVGFYIGIGVGSAALICFLSLCIFKYFYVASQHTGKTDEPNDQDVYNPATA